MSGDLVPRHYADRVEALSIPGREYVLVFGTATLITFLLTGLVRVVAIRIKALTPIRDRDVHQLPTPRMGGVALYAGVAGGVLMALQLPALSQAFTASTEIKGVLVAGAVIVLVGLLDDRFDLDSVTKLAGQVLAGGVLVLFGVQWLVLWLPNGNPGGVNVVLGGVEGGAVTVLLTLILTNAMNFIDGLDGLLTGVAIIASAAIFIFSVHQFVKLGNPDSSQPPIMAAALMGACLGFLPHNFSPARIFLGDSGSMFIGLTMAAATTSAGGKLAQVAQFQQSWGIRNTIALLAPLIVVLAVVFIPVLDFLLAVIRRTREGRHPFSADKRHLHHRMLAIGHTHRQAVLDLLLVGVRAVRVRRVAEFRLPRPGRRRDHHQARGAGRSRRSGAGPGPDLLAVAAKTSVPPEIRAAARQCWNSVRTNGRFAVTRGRSEDQTLAQRLAEMEKAIARGRAWSLEHLRVCWIALGIGTVLVTVAGFLVDGAGGGVAALVGGLIVGAFFTVSAVVIAKAGQVNPRLTLPAALGTYFVKIVALGVVVSVVPSDGFLVVRWLAGGVLVGLICWLGAHLRYVWTLKIFYVDPS